jgi:fluoroacetyl-CoA thioesterase
MKPGIKPGQTAEIEFLVTPEMFAQFQGTLVHELLSTSALVYQMEWAARQIILPYLEAHEEGMGSRVDVHHSMMTPGGVKVKVRATVTEIRDNKIECEVEATNARGKVAKGVVVQAIVEKSWVSNKIREIEVVDGIRK